MKKFLFALTATTALALGALAVPMAASAASNHSSGGNAGGRGGVAAVHSFNGGSANMNVRGPQNFAANTNARINTNTRVNNNARTWNGQQWAWNGRHHHRHDRDFLFFPFAGYDDTYASYDTCWQTQWTPAGWQTVYVCGPSPYGYY
ncbi:MAG TPA: hypothetical protein VKT73_16410 [Xanthobacteraceae bacterium]|nr:hypothetical protein [Xanthobacteraceae bacterium]